MTARKTILSTSDPVSSHTPDRRRVIPASMNILNLSLCVKLYHTESISATMKSNRWIYMPLLNGSPRLLTKNSSNAEVILTIPGIIPYMISTSRSIDTAIERIKPFHEKLYLRKYHIKTMAGMASRFSRCTPMERPIMKAISMIHLSACGSSATSSHFSIAQNTTAVKSEEVA
ncbi:MAG: hypothetical protein BWY89_01550 [Bacteroidetes bacterium ADurb.BinA012]|nr:MAG: hypothetical protein BWY89_01550 [Bacteroidetes bacterium ADurb.BinA012]